MRQENALGSTIRIVDAQTGNGMLRFRYDVFGKAYIAHEGTPNNYTYYNSVMLRFLYTGREMLATAGGIGAGLMDYRNRIYSPTLGRFLQPDPIGFEAGDVNWYRYVGNNAVNFTDPEGLMANRGNEREQQANNAIDTALKIGKETADPTPSNDRKPGPSMDDVVDLAKGLGCAFWGALCVKAYKAWSECISKNLPDIDCCIELDIRRQVICDIASRVCLAL